MERLDQAKYETLGLLSPLEILALRQKFGKSQEQMADLLRIGRKTYCRWENGTFFQTRANDNYLRLVLWLTKNVSDPVSVLQGLDNPNRQSRGHTFFIATREAYFEPNILLHRRGRCCLQAEETVV
jgi:DNA-binding transcriptional regulator YiaG